MGIRFSRRKKVNMSVQITVRFTKDKLLQGSPKVLFYHGNVRDQEPKFLAVWPKPADETRCLECFLVFILVSKKPNCAHTPSCYQCSRSVSCHKYFWNGAIKWVSKSTCETYLTTHVVCFSSPWIKWSLNIQNADNIGAQNHGLKALDTFDSYQRHASSPPTYA